MDSDKYTVLIVDDEEIVTESINTLLTLETDYNILIFYSPSEALDMLQSQEIDLVISDYLMPILAEYFNEHSDFALAGMSYTQAHERIGQLISGMSEGAQRIQKIV